jgi:O-antigen ligase
LLLTVAVFQIISHQDIFRRYSNGDVEGSYLFYSGFSDWLMHPAYLSLFIGASTILLYFNGKNLFTKRMFWSHFIIHILYLFQLQGRMNIIALLLLAIVIAFITFVKQFSFKKSLFFISLICVSFFVFWQIFPSEIKGRFSEPLRFNYDIQSPTFDGFNGLTIRLAEWECALDAISRAPLLGHGIGQSKEILHQSFEQKGFVYGLKQGYNAHNQYLEIALAVGWIGLCVFVSICAMLLYQAYQSHNQAAIYILIYTFLCFATESYLERQWGVHFFAFIIPLILFYPTKLKT